LKDIKIWRKRGERHPGTDCRQKYIEMGFGGTPRKFISLTIWEKTGE